jgi:hypothetical protein
VYTLAFIAQLLFMADPLAQIQKVTRQSKQVKNHTAARTTEGLSHRHTVQADPKARLQVLQGKYSQEASVPLQLPQDQLSRAASAIAFLLLVLNSLLPVRVGVATMLTAPLPLALFSACFVRAGPGCVARVRSVGGPAPHRRARHFAQSSLAHLDGGNLA